ncbi:MAG: hypothetical protein ACI9KE_001472 [Polyangiales bacterium]|jgi:hypothetical protein
MGDAEPSKRIFPPTSGTTFATERRKFMRWFVPFTLTVFLFLAALPASPAEAESWCAYPLWVHEWGVQVFDAQGQPTPPVSMPSWFHRSGRGGGASGQPVRHMPADGGDRELPVLHFYSSGSMSAPIPVSIEVGFTAGDASVWYPQVDSHRSAAHAHLPVSLEQRARLLRQRQARTPFQPAQGPLPRDWTRQLFWDRLELSSTPVHPTHNSRTPWVDALREFDRAMWVNGAAESERFVFYEADTREQVALTIERGDEWRSGHRHIVLRNRASHPIHDVVLTHREGQSVYLIHAPSIPAGRSAGFVLDDHPLGSVSGRDVLRASLVDTSQPTPPTTHTWNGDECTMMRDPAIPVEIAEGHRLYAAEVEAILNIWAPTMFDQAGTTVTYREDVAYLDAMMPLSIYTDMYNFVLLRRAGLAVWSNVLLP